MDTKQLQKSFESVIERTKLALATIRSGRASPALVDHLLVECYGTKVPLKQLASLSVPEPKILLVQAWDAGSVKDIERALQASDLGLSPSVDGTALRLTLPPLTEETRREKLRLVRERVEEAKVFARKHRDEFLRSVRDAERQGSVSEDVRTALEKEVTKAMEAFAERLGVIAEKKEQELMTL